MNPIQQQQQNPSPQSAVDAREQIAERRRHQLAASVAPDVDRRAYLRWLRGTYGMTAAARLPDEGAAPATRRPASAARDSVPAAPPTRRTP